MVRSALKAFVVVAFLSGCCVVSLVRDSSERASATNNRGEQLRQGANINKSLLSLANCINALAGNRRRRGGKVRKREGEYFLSLIGSV